MRSKLITFYTICLMLICATPAFALHHRHDDILRAKAKATGACSTIKNINSISGVLYKSLNVHGGRGPTFLVQNPAYQTHQKSLPIYGTNKKVIGSFGLWACDHPYGCRYYTGIAGGSHDGPSNIAAKAKKNGGSIAFLVGAPGGLCIEVSNPSSKQGNVRK